MAKQQIPMGKIRKISGQPSDSYKGMCGNHAKTIRFLWEKVRQLVENYQVPMEKKKTLGKP